MKLYKAGFIATSLALALSVITANYVVAITNKPLRNYSITIAQSPKIKDTTIIPGKRVGNINKSTKRADLVKIFGASKLKDETTRFFGGDSEFSGTVINLGKDKSLTIFWKDAKRTQAVGVIVSDPAWKTPEGIGINTSINTLRQKIGDFTLSGFGWDYGGIPALKNTKISHYQGQLILRMGLDSSTYQKYPKETLAVSGEQQLSSKDPRWKLLNPTVRSMIVFF
jgi:hypothetical protein